jgi:hypothetical protein
MNHRQTSPKGAWTRGPVQHDPLIVNRILERAVTLFPRQEIVTWTKEGLHRKTSASSTKESCGGDSGSHGRRPQAFPKGIRRGEPENQRRVARPPGETTGG